ncbi:hypothetical protein FSP39_006268 [Pinctada imbricata]|uniref:Ankyrin repeat domain-containing protein 49 n=1 Tax=Pinctada imbricata TaxID=66713 RepID=A0AA89C0W5_PINIB|nr:hypothetical protein FSP39_006268 [Pinctada imbricata]
MLHAAAANPALFQNYCEMDDDSDEETEEEIQKNPQKKMLWAAENNKADVVQDLIKEEKDLVNSTDSDMYTPLHRACYNGHTDMVRLLLANGANIEAKTIDGWHPIHSAARWNQAQVISVLIENGADINATTKGGQTPLHLASSQKDSKETLIILLQNPKVDVDVKNSTGDTAEDVCKRTSKLCKLFQKRRDKLLKEGEKLSLDSEANSSSEADFTSEKLKSDKLCAGHVDHCLAQIDANVSRKMDKIVEEEIENLLLDDNESSNTAEIQSVQKENSDKLKCSTTSDESLMVLSSGAQAKHDSEISGTDVVT